MDAVFQLEGGSRSSFIQMMMQSFGSSYVCLWSSLSPSSCLVFLDGLCHDEGNGQPNALFNQYKQSMFIIHPIHNQVPGFAFGNNMPYIEVREDQFSTLASNDIQRQFYQEERIKMAVFMGCRSGEIEIGFSNAPLADMEMQMMSLFPDDFLRNLPLPDIQIPAAENLNPRPSSSSSSLRSPFSIDSHSPEYSSLLFNLPSTAATPAAASSSSQALLITTPSAITPTTTTTFPEQLTRFSTTESEHAAMTSAFLAVMTSPSLSSTLNPPQQHPQPPPQQHLPRENLQPSAFARYTRARFKPGSSRRHSMLKRAIAYCRGMNLIRLHDRLQGVSSGSARPMSSTHIHHVMSERKRREKLNESYQSLKTLLPPGTKKYKAAVLAATREYLTLLRSQVEDLRRRNAVLEAQLLPPPSKEAAAAADESAASSSHEQTQSREEVSVRTVSDPASTSSQDRTADLRVIVRRDVRTLDLVARILEFLRQARNHNVMSINANARVTHQGGIESHVIVRLHVEGEEWEERALEEAVRRVVADFSQ